MQIIVQIVCSWSTIMNLTFSFCEPADVLVLSAWYAVICVCSHCISLSSCVTWDFLEWKYWSEAHIILFCCTNDYLDESWLILTFAMKLSVIVCVHKDLFVLWLMSGGKWILTFTSVFHLCSIKYTTGAFECCTGIQKHHNGEGVSNEPFVRGVPSDG